MTGALFLAEFDEARPGDVVTVEGEEARHAGVKRIEPGEEVLVANGRGLGVRGPCVDVTRDALRVRAEEVLREAPRRRVTAVQALPKGDRGPLAVQMLTELGATTVVAWQSERAIVRWRGDRGAKALAKWAATARESAKQSRRLTVPEVRFATTGDLEALLGPIETVLVLHEDASMHLRDVDVPGDTAIVVGPEGGISPAELDVLESLGAVPVRIADHVLRTSTAGAVALGQLELK
ncbi:16S rRNA (uracil(1498)-N(3))-methyltransferase [uncultured Tessaracoccus sp.]|uniref:16S rRNA (uracil(1498)-N(3))-methyltransferase n=1 Tax=uncultured Tessaracoccus sp. TaxID=905023 RepID=UPI0025FC4CF1|nr:16S rRNA (uracil(1498)-N(3))-methyltransferase [uncultured Tessaracoccus sp.]